MILVYINSGNETEYPNLKSALLDSNMVDVFKVPIKLDGDTSVLDDDSYMEHITVKKMSDKKSPVVIGEYNLIDDDNELSANSNGIDDACDRLNLLNAIDATAYIDLALDTMIVVLEEK